MLLLFTLGMLLLTLFAFKNVMFPNLEKLATMRESFITEANKDPNFVKFWAVAFLVVVVLILGLNSLYLGFAVNFLLGTGVLLAKVAAGTAAGLFFIGLVNLAHTIGKMFNAVDDPTAFRDVILGFPTPLKQLWVMVSHIIWVGFYTILVYFLMQ